MSCKHLRDGCCANPRTPYAPDLLIAASVCASCDQYAGPPRGLGDVVEVAARLTGVAAVVKAATGGRCGCQRRREAMNRSVPFASKVDSDEQPI